jgi:arylsulfatase A-like enzyme
MAPHVNGFNSSDFILDPNTYNYLHAVMTRNGRVPVSYKGQYSPDVTAEKAYDYLDEAMSHDEPWFVGIAPIAPHSHVETFNASDSTYANTEPKYAERHAHLFKDYNIPRDANFNPKTPSGVSWVRKLERLNETVIEYNDEFQRARLRALQSVDEMVEKLVKKLEAKGELDNTYIIYTTDNGYHISQHRE